MGEWETYVISDLHLGGSPALQVLPDHVVRFQLCTPETCRRLARFVHAVMARHPDANAELVINGDFIDFLAEEKVGVSPPEFEAFTASTKDALAKLQRVMERCHDGAGSCERVFDALRAFVGRGFRLSILIGNHDVELCLPPVRSWLVQWLTCDRPHRVQFLYDGEAYQRDGILIEHGNRYDGWNAVDHGALRATRSRMSRCEPESALAPPPGSRLVVEVMNEIKLRYPFIDMLKPENEALIPLLAAIDSKLLRDIRRIWRGAALGLAQRGRAPRDGVVPENEAMIAATVPPAEPFIGEDVAALERTRRLLEQASVGDGEPVDEHDAQISASDAVRSFLRSTATLWPVVTALPRRKWQALHDAWREYAGEIGATFAIDRELPRYLEAARRLCPRDGVVIFGHTHLAKSVPLGTGRYLNTGTWVPTIELPKQLYDGTLQGEAAVDEVERFVVALCQGEAALRQQCTFARVSWLDGKPRGQLYEFRDDGSERALDAT